MSFACIARRWQAAKGAKIADLEEQLRDVMFYLETQKHVEQSPHRDEIVGGQIVVQPETPPTRRQQRRPGGKR